MLGVAVTTFSVTHDTVRTEHFPHWNAFSATTKPTSTQVGTYVTEEAADLGGYLALKSIAASGIDSSANPNGFAWCQKTLKLMVAVRVAKAATASNPELAKTLQDEVNARLSSLDKHGATLLVDVTASTSGNPAEGPTTHISTYSLTVDDSSDMSTTVPRLRRDDSL